MSFKIMDGRLRPKKEATFGKKPFKGKAKNRKGNKKKFTVPVYEHEPLNSSRPVRFSAAKYKVIQDAIRKLGVCQVCDMSHELDAPHHVMQGGCKDDRYLINICIICHRLIHNVGYSAVKKDRSECKVIAWSNHIYFEKN